VNINKTPIIGRALSEATITGLFHVLYPAYAIIKSAQTAAMIKDEANKRFSTIILNWSLSEVIPIAWDNIETTAMMRSITPGQNSSLLLLGRFMIINNTVVSNISTTTISADASATKF
jgi:hypothetical protein